MTKGSWIHDDVSRHLRLCEQCRIADPENHRVKHDAAGGKRQPGQVSERDVPPATFAAMCPDGRSIYRSYLSWLAEPDE